MPVHLCFTLGSDRPAAEYAELRPICSKTWHSYYTRFFFTLVFTLDLAADIYDWEDKRCSVHIYKKRWHDNNTGYCGRGGTSLSQTDTNWTTFVVEEADTLDEDRFEFRSWKQNLISFWWFFAEVEVISFCGLLPSDHHHGDPQPSPRCAHVCWTVHLFSCNHFQLSVGIRGQIGWIFVISTSARFCTACNGKCKRLCLSLCRCFQAEHRGSDTQVFDTHNPCFVGSVCLGLHLYLDFCYVLVLSSWTLQKVGSCTICHTVTHHLHKIMLNICIAQQNCVSFLSAIISSFCIIACKQISPPSLEAICNFLFTCGRLPWLNIPLPPTDSNNIILAPDRQAYDWMYTTPAVLPYGFHVSIIINVCLNITWLFLFDRE